jgi:hypothetical protein
MTSAQEEEDEKAAHNNSGGLLGGVLPVCKIEFCFYNKTRV